MLRELISSLKGWEHGRLVSNSQKADFSFRSKVSEVLDVPVAFNLVREHRCCLLLIVCIMLDL